MKSRVIGHFVLWIGLLLPLVAIAQTPPPSGTPTLEARIAQLEEDIATLRAQPAAEDGPLSSLNAFNPRITVFGNFLARLDDRRVENDEGDAIDDRFHLREVELDFRAAIDPWAEGVLIVAVESEAPGEFETGVEEGYVIFKRLPFIDEAPWGLRIQAGRFRPEFGRLNQVHTHDFAQSTRPRSLMGFLGEEGFVQDGIAASVLVPTPGENHALRLSAALVNGGEIAIAEDNEGEDPAFVGRTGLFVEPSAGHEIECGLSAYVGKADENGSRRATLYGLDLSYFWKPYVAGEWRSFLIAGELYHAEIEQAGRDRTPVGGNVWAQMQCTRNTYLNTRFDYTEDPTDPSIQTRTPGVFVSYYTTEFLRLRLGYERTYSDDDELDGLDTVMFEINFVFGSHPAEPYWVRRG